MLLLTCFFEMGYHNVTFLHRDSNEEPIVDDIPSSAKEDVGKGSWWDRKITTESRSIVNDRRQRKATPSGACCYSPVSEAVAGREMADGGCLWIGWYVKSLTSISVNNPF